jgi:16S rRNA (cytosine1402-N4)-methyltransferase
VTGDESSRPKRRPRYKGKNPRRFEEKYKELDPARHAETIARVIASGKTPAGAHLPVMVTECLAALRLAPGMTGIDATLGHGGHARAILQAISPGGRLVGMDLDPVEMPRTSARLAARDDDGSQFEAVRSNYAGLAKVLADRGLAAVDFIFADLGCSSMQLDDPARGFSFKTSGPLDMRMNPQRGLSAAGWLQRISAEKLEMVLHQNADEPRNVELAAALAGQSFGDTLALADAIRANCAGSGAEETEKTIRRVFQAVRIAVNEEFTALDAFLRVLPSCLKPGARAAILTFHSGEDRRVKQAFKQGLRDGLFSETSEGVQTPMPEERRDNPRSTPAKLRWAQRY